MEQLPPLFLAGNFLSVSGGSRGPIEDLAERLGKMGTSLVCASRFRNKWIRSADLLSTAVFQRNCYKAAIVDLYSGPAFLWGEALSVILHKLRRPFILVLHGGSLPEFAAHHPRRVQACLRRASIVTAPSNYLIDGMKPYRSDIELVPNPINLSSFDYRERYHPRPDIVWIRAFHEMYNPMLAPQAIALLREEFPNISLTMVGGDKGDGSLQRTKTLAKGLGVEGNIRFTGAVPCAEIPRFLAAGDIFLNTTNVDNTPVSVLEAMASGLCVVSTNVGGIPHLLQDGVHALLVPPGDPKAMAQALRRILTEKRLAAQLSRNGREKAQQSDWSRLIPQWRKVLSRLVDGADK